MMATKCATCRGLTMRSFTVVASILLLCMALSVSADNHDDKSNNYTKEQIYRRRLQYGAFPTFGTKSFKGAKAESVPSVKSKSTDSSKTIMTVDAGKRPMETYLPNPNDAGRRRPGNNFGNPINVGPPTTPVVTIPTISNTPPVPANPPQQVAPTPAAVNGAGGGRGQNEPSFGGGGGGGGEEGEGEGGETGGGSGATPSRAPVAIPPWVIAINNKFNDLATYVPPSSPSSPSQPSAPVPVPAPAPVPVPAPAPVPVPAPTPMIAPIPSVTFVPSAAPSASPSALPSMMPSDEPSSTPSFMPSSTPSLMPSSTPSLMPSSTPSFMPSSTPSSMPSSTPSKAPVSVPSRTLAPVDAPTTRGNDLNPVTICYEDFLVAETGLTGVKGLGARGSNVTNRGDWFASPVANVVLEPGQDLHVKLAATTFSLVESPTLNSTCLNDLLTSGGRSFLGVEVVLRNAATERIVDAVPSNSLILAMDFHGNYQYYYGVLDRLDTYESYSRTNGEFFFQTSNILTESTEFQLVFRFVFEGFALAQCVERANGVVTPLTAEALVGLGPYVLSYEPITITGSTQCTETTARSSFNARKLQTEGTLLDKVGLCYQSDIVEAESILEATNFTDDRSETNSTDVAFALDGITMEAGDSLHVHVLASMRSELTQQLLSLCLPPQTTSAQTTMDIQVSLQDQTTREIYEASPSSTLSLYNESIFQNLTSGEFSPASYELFQKDTVAGGDFYFLNVPLDGTYSVLVNLTLSASTFSDCSSSFYYPSSRSLVQIGPRLFTYEVLSIDEPTQCETTFSSDLRSGTDGPPAGRRKLQLAGDKSQLRLCFQEEFFVTTTARANDFGREEVEEVLVGNIDFGEIVAEAGDDFYTKLSVSTVRILFDQLEDASTLLPICADAPEQNTAESIELSLTASMTLVNDVGASIGIPIEPVPSQPMLLTFDSFTKQHLVKGPMPYGLEFLIDRSAETNGEFYFVDVPAGTYALEFRLTATNKAQADCGVQRRLNRERRNLQDRTTIAGAQVSIGPHVVSVEKINVLSSGQCANPNQ